LRREGIVSLAEVMSAARALPREEQLQLARTLLAESDSWEAFGLVPGREYPILTPFYDCPEAAAILQQLLDEERAKG
jgi:hypothetical protein